MILEYVREKQWIDAGLEDDDIDWEALRKRIEKRGETGKLKDWYIAEMGGLMQLSSSGKPASDDYVRNCLSAAVSLCGEVTEWATKRLDDAEETIQIQLLWPDLEPPVGGSARP